jgi:AcrR family transcriptional regulator
VAGPERITAEGLSKPSAQAATHAPSEGPEVPLSLREEQRQLTRRRIAEAALSIFREKGYLSATVDDIVARARTSRATFYQHFANKLAALQFASLDVEAWSYETYDVLREGLLTRDKVCEMVAQVFHHWQRNAELLRVLIEAEAVEPERLVRNMRNMEGAVDRTFGAQLDKFSGRELDVVRVELFMAGMVTARYMAYEFASDRHRTDLSVPIEAMTNVLWNILSPRIGTIA